MGSNMRSELFIIRARCKASQENELLQKRVASSKELVDAALDDLGSDRTINEEVNCELSQGLKPSFLAGLNGIAEQTAEKCRFLVVLTVHARLRTTCNDKSKGI
jgi:hypothetical protein